MSAPKAGQTASRAVRLAAGRAGPSCLLAILAIVMMLALTGCGPGQEPPVDVPTTSSRTPDVVEPTEPEWTEDEPTEPQLAEPEPTEDEPTAVDDWEGVDPTTAPAQPAFSEYASITPWYSPAMADDSAWVHFKAVDEYGYTVAEVTGSDLMDLAEESEAMDQTSERVALVTELRRTMLDEGWTELGVQGDWYQFVYGR